LNSGTAFTDNYINEIVLAGNNAGKANEVLSALFDAAGMLLVDFKLEFGLFKGKIVLGDEFSPDGCRLWDKATRKKLDKDRFRQGLGGVVEAYEEVAQRLGVNLG
jgi:phosphoribosylaminoimidazole-succinocarboxamide synthase